MLYNSRAVALWRGNINGLAEPWAHPNSGSTLPAERTDVTYRSLPQVRHERHTWSTWQPQNHGPVSAKWDSSLLAAHPELCSHRLGRLGLGISGSLHVPTASQSVSDPNSSKKPAWHHFKRNEAKEISGLPPSFWAGKEIPAALPLKLVPKPQHQRRANILELYKRGYNIFSIVFEKGTVLMWLGHMKIIAGCRITKQELSAWTAVMKMYQKGEREKKKRKANYEWKKRRDESFLKLACLWSIHRCLGAGSATVPFCFSLEIQDMSISYPSW